ncbi:hypothetical protein JZ751_004331 [Albula glossodonta]|uniref:EHMT1/2 cysteine-rich region domain-containing protein n=1 Tax=Albula glossodonta TaxID=121402 RepID=A0A8T2N5I8_9TELE|nr:hypothetical protein JZ751_004331 [Albula glossodonta]
MDTSRPEKEAERSGERGGGSEMVAVEGISSEYTEVPLGSLDIAAADSLTLSPQQGQRDRSLVRCVGDSEARDRETDGLFSASLQGRLVGCTNTIVKGETMRPSSRVSLMVLCETHRSHMVKHHCCPGCGYFCITGTFLECCPDLRIAHRFHRGCVSVLGGGGRDRGRGMGGLLFCPHCGEDASEAQEVTVPTASAASATVVTASASTTTPSLPPPPLPSSLSLAASNGGPPRGMRAEGPRR